jgi:hypothetical protein
MDRLKSTLPHISMLITNNIRPWQKCRAIRIIRSKADSRTQPATTLQVNKCLPRPMALLPRQD